MNNKYEDRVRLRATEFAKEWEAHNIKHVDPEYAALLIDEFIPLARLSVQREAEAFVGGWNAKFSNPHELMPGNKKRFITANEYAEEIGLIPPKTQTT